MKIFLIISFAAAAIAQTSSSTGTLGGVIGAAPLRVQLVGGGVAGGFEGMPGAVVIGEPYSAEEVTEHVQTLADGTHITQPAPKVRYYRDSQGRTRTERTFPLPPGASAAGIDAPSFIEIFDSVSGARYTLEPRSHTARKMSFVTVPPPPPPPNSVSISGTGTSQVNRTAQILPAFTPAPPFSAPDEQEPRPQFSHDSLGTQTFDGVLAEGSRTTVVYPIGAVGNDRPITTVSETWSSPDLKVTILSKNSDPRNGDSTTRLTNISRADPDPSLFQVPPDYDVIDPQVAVPKQ